MKVIDLIRHYDRDKSQHSPISESLSPKLTQLMVTFGQLDAGVSGFDIVARARNAWPNDKPGTTLRKLGQLRAVFRVAERDGLIPKAPHISMPHVYDVVDCPITPSEARMLIDHMRTVEPKWWPLAAVLMNTGCRLSEALRLTPESFTCEGVVVRKPVERKTKTVARVIPYTKQLGEMMNVSRESVGKLWRFGSVLTYSGAHSIASQLGRAIGGACQDLGLPEIRVHDLRHVFAALVAERGGDLADIASLLGHTNLRTTLRYRGLVQQRAKRILENA